MPIFGEPGLGGNNLPGLSSLTFYRNVPAVDVRTRVRIRIVIDYLTLLVFGVWFDLGLLLCFILLDDGLALAL